MHRDGKETEEEGKALRQSKIRQLQSRTERMKRQRNGRKVTVDLKRLERVQDVVCMWEVLKIRTLLVIDYITAPNI